MKNVTLSAVVRTHARRHLLCPIRSWHQLGQYAATLALGLPVIAFFSRFVDPTAPLAWIVVAVLAGGLVPAFALLPGRLEVNTRFQVHHLVHTLDDSLGRLGYVKTAEHAAGVLYRRQRHRWKDAAADIAVTLHANAADIAGPLGTLRALQRQLSG